MVCDRNSGRRRQLGESRAKCDTHCGQKVDGVLSGGRADQPGGTAPRRPGVVVAPVVRADRRLSGIHYRVDYGSLSHLLNTLYCLGFMAANGYVQYRIRRSGTVKPVWLFGLSALDLAAISFSVSLSGGFNSPYLALYYLAVAVFAYVFTAPRPVLPWTTLVAALYSVMSVTVKPGLDLSGKEESSLSYRVVALYAVSAAVGIIAGLERESRRRGLDRELQRKRIELSQKIHDTTAQWAYMIGLGLEGALELVDQSNAALLAKLRLVADLSRSAMWELRHPIDGGQLFRGEELGEVLEAHAATFTVITSVPAELVRHGTEPDLSTITKSLLFSIAHNALTNVLRHAGASRVVISGWPAPVRNCGCPCPTTAGGCRRTTTPGATGSETCGATPSGWADALG